MKKWFVVSFLLLLVAGLLHITGSVNVRISVVVSLEALTGLFMPCYWEYLASSNAAVSLVAGG